jgi:hypothetical protein
MRRALDVEMEARCYQGMQYLLVKTVGKETRCGLDAKKLARRTLTLCHCVSLKAEAEALGEHDEEHSAISSPAPRETEG